MNDHEKLLRFGQRLFLENKSPMEIADKVFDFGSGSGSFVTTLRKQEYEAWGADFYDDNQKILEHPYLKSINFKDGYSIPFQDDFFDYSFSQNVFEHVQDYDAALSELARITKPGGFGVHLFPSRLILVERHVNVPGGTLFQSYFYQYLWAWYSRQNPKWRGTKRAQYSAKETATLNAKFLKNQTNYLPGKAILANSRKYFTESDFIDADFFRLWPGRINRLAPLVNAIPILGTLHSIFRMRVLFFRK